MARQRIAIYRQHARQRPLIIRAMKIDRITIGNSKLTTKLCAATILAAGLCLTLARADDRRFTYTYEPELLPKGAMEFEQWITLRTQRTSGGDVKQGNYNLWELREELEFGVTDNYSVSLYLNTAAESFRDFSQTPAVDESDFKFEGISIENRYMVLN